MYYISTLLRIKKLWRGGLSDRLEESPEEYIQNLVEVFREVRNLLTEDGTLWVNIGDSYYNYRPGKGQGLVKQTVSKFYRVSGESTQSKGVVPDIALPSLINLEEVGENQKEYALVWDQISGVAPLPLPEKKALSVKRLENLHLERRIQDPNLKSIIERIQLSKAISENDVFSLNLKERKDQSVNWDNALFSIENDRRLSIGEEIFDTVDEWKAFNDQLNSDDPDRPKSESDPLLFETSRILADYISLNERS